MSLSLFVLALYVFLQSAVQLAMFSVDPKFMGLVGLAFVIIVIIESLFFVKTGHFFLNRVA